MRLRITFLLATVLLAVMGTASAAILNFNLTNYSGSQVWTSGAVSVTVSAYSMNQSTNVFSGASLGQYSGGLGVSNSADDSYPANQHAVDNADGRTDFILLQFSTPVDPLSVTINQYNSDSDMDYWTGNIPASLAGLSLSNLSGYTSGSNDSSGSRTISLTSGVVSALLIAADINGGCNDFFKLAGLSVDYSTTPPPGQIPEPSTYATMGGALVGLGLVMAKRRRAN